MSGILLSTGACICHDLLLCHSLSLPTLSFLFPATASSIFVAAALADCPDKWDAVGLFLGIPFKVIEWCRLEDTLEERIREVVNAWLGRKYEVEHFGEPSWRKLVEAIAHKAGGYHKRLALKLAKDHPVFIGGSFQLEDGSRWGSDTRCRFHFKSGFYLSHFCSGLPCSPQLDQTMIPPETTRL